jgi:hypothetical protein
MSISTIKSPSFLVQTKGLDILPDLEVINRMVGRRRTNSKLILLQETILAEASGLVEPSAVWTRLDIKSDSTLPRKLTGILSDAEAVIGAVCTIGEKLEIQSRQYFSEQEYTRGYLLDQIGTLTVAKLAQEVAENLQGKYDAVHWAPGDDPSDLSLNSQQLLFDLVPAHRIGVQLSDLSIMVPSYSLSFFLVIGAKAKSLQCSIPCSRCAWNGKCDKRLQQISTKE